MQREKLQLPEVFSCLSVCQLSEQQTIEGIAYISKPPLGPLLTTLYVSQQRLFVKIRAIYWGSRDDLEAVY